MKWLALGAAALLLTLSACGYHAPVAGDDWPGRDGRTLYVDLFANATTEPYLDSVVTDEVAVQMSRSRLIELTEDRATADLLLNGTVTAFASSAGAYNRQDEISEYTASMTVTARLLRRSDGSVLWKETLSRSQTYAAFADKSLQQDVESLAARTIAKRIAEDLLARLLSRF